MTYLDKIKNFLLSNYNHVPDKELLSYVSTAETTLLAKFKRIEDPAQHAINWAKDILLKRIAFQEMVERQSKKV